MREEREESSEKLKKEREESDEKLKKEREDDQEGENFCYIMKSSS